MPGLNHRWLNSSFALAAAGVTTATGLAIEKELVDDSTNVRPHAKKIKSRDDERRDRVDQAVQQFLKQTNAPGVAVGVAVDGHVVSKRGYGLADIENDIPITATTMMRIASISKPITAALVGRLIEQGKLSLDDSVYKYVPNFPQKDFNGERFDITIRSLLNHTTGIRNYYDEQWKRAQRSPSEGAASKKPLMMEDLERRDQLYTMYGHETTDQGHDHVVERLLRRRFASSTDALSLFADSPLVVAPGSVYVYSTYNYTLLDAAMEAASGQNFERLTEDLFNVLNMRSTRVERNEPIIAGRSRQYRLNRHNEIVNCPEVDLSYKFAGGGLMSTIGDVLKFANAMLQSYQGAENYNGQTPILKRSTVDTLWHCLLVGPRYALGFQRHFLIRPAKDEAAQAATLKSGSGGIWYHIGAGVGASSIVMISAEPVREDDGERRPMRGVCVAIIANIQDVGVIARQLALDIVAIYSGRASDEETTKQFPQ